MISARGDDRCVFFGILDRVKQKMADEQMDDRSG